MSVLTIDSKRNKVDYEIERIPNINEIMTSDPFLSSDYHLLKKLNPNKALKEDITEDIIRNHNDVVSPNDWFIFLGDISEYENYDSKEKIIQIKKCIARLNGKKIIVLGNNDSKDKNVYTSFKNGFLYCREKIEWRDYVFTHDPIYIGPDKINFHGHIHGSRNYWIKGGNKLDNHIDCYHKLNGFKPLRMSEYLKLHKEGFYRCDSGNSYLEE